MIKNKISEEVGFRHQDAYIPHTIGLTQSQGSRTLPDIWIHPPLKTKLKHSHNNYMIKIASKDTNFNEIQLLLIFHTQDKNSSILNFSFIIKSLC